MSTSSPRMIRLIAVAFAMVLIGAIGFAVAPASADPVQARPEPADALTIMSFNIASFHDCAKPIGCLYVDPDYMLGVVADLIVDNGVDVAGLQEIDKLTNHHPGSDMLADLQAKLIDRGYPMFGWFEARDGVPPAITQGEFGVAMLSRVPAISYSSELFASSIHASSSPVQRAQFDFDGTVVTVLNLHAHVQGSCDVIDPGAVDVVQGVPASPGVPAVPDMLDEFTVVIGDFNDAWNSPCMTTLGTTHESVCLDAGVPIDPTCAIGVDQVLHPNHTWAVDHIMYRFAAESATSFLDGWVDQTVNENATTHPGANWVSDHYPIIGRFALNTPVSGDVNCDGAADLVDALMIAQHAAALRSGASGCPLGLPTSTLNVDHADMNADTLVNAADAQLILDCLVTSCS